MVAHGPPETTHQRLQTHRTVGHHTRVDRFKLFVLHLFDVVTTVVVPVPFIEVLSGTTARNLTALDQHGVALRSSRHRVGYSLAFVFYK